MGNAGSAHNLHNDCIQSELNLCYTQQYLRRTTGETKNNKNQVVLDGWSSGRNVADCKVLPKSVENFKLRSTTNGAILQAGGTISFRAKEAMERKTEPTYFHPMRRSHTLILDGQNDTISKRKSAPSLTEFRRSQTLLFVGYNKRKTVENISENFDFTPLPPAQNISSSSTLKVNKYNKKRKAPAAPTTKNLCKEDVASPAQNQFLDDTKIPTTLPKPRIYTTNNSKAQLAQKQLQPPTMKVAHFQRDSKVRTSAKTSRQSQHTRTNSTYASKLPYRREKSFDVKFVRQNKSNDYSDRRAASKEYLDANAHDGSGKKALAIQQGNFVTNKCHSTVDQLKNRAEMNEEKFDLNETKNFAEYSASTKGRKIKFTQSRIPQLKSTFYFGMDSAHKSPTATAPAKINENMLEESDNSIVLNHKIEAEEEIVDNGILVHVRPTLPRRQLETPNFSPAVAWRNLLEEQQRLQLERSKTKQNSAEQRIIESPICLKSGAETNWTPQQDLGDDDDDERKEVKKADNFANSLHIFSLSLPRDVHLQCQTKSSAKYMKTKNNLNPANCWLVPGFSSLQKLKTQLGNPTDLPSNTKCTCASRATNIRHTTYQLENTFADSLTMDSKGYHHHQSYCELNKSSSQPTYYQNNNWLLHRSKDLTSVDTTKILDDTCIKPSSNSLSFINFQPKSLGNICSGKHIVYLPGQGALNSSLKESSKSDPKQNKTNTSNYKRQRQRQSNERESLQDLTPIQNIHQSNVDVTEKNTHRFSFQNTVHILEKRRLAEKLSKDAEVQEAQRLNELEVMKRVEEDFQRKRAPEKANLRKQLRLHFKANAENAEYRSLPLNINDKCNNQHVSDANNNIFCRAEPDGAVSPPAELMLSARVKTSKGLDCFAYDGEESESETQLPDLQCTDLLIEPYLNSII